MKDIKKVKENLVKDLREFVQSRKFSMAFKRIQMVPAIKVRER